ncbi:MFS transporter [Glaciimonas soli]|uniref:MFS transporter n=1 Tax=Glaciimonas soli TaxID=2590999 RepID=A0A843YXX2_9BURK|nr:MFS transporter [Glaciimonas soli]MQR02514.1 MFS transporter [Glaciimonas soli]
MSNPNRWWGVITLLLLVTIAYIDRINVAVMLVNPEFLAHFNLQGDRSWQGALMTVFLLGYGISAMFLTPWLETLLGYRQGLIWSVLAWALLTAVSPLTGSLLLLLMARTLLGIAEGPLFSLKTMYISDHFSHHEYGKPNAVTAIGVSLGLAIGFPLITLLMTHLGWHATFYVLTAVNLLIGLSFVLLFIQPKRSSPSQPSQVSASTTSNTSVAQRVWSTFVIAWQTPMLMWIMVIEMATLSYLWGTTSWLPAYLIDEKHFSLKQMGIFSSLPFIISIAAKYAGGVWLDRMPPYKAPLVFVFGGIAAALSIWGIIHSEAIWATAFFMLAANAFWGAQGSAIPTLIQHYAKRSAVGSTYGLINGVGNFFSACVPVLMGVVMTHYGKVSSGFFILLISQIVAAIGGVILFMRGR